MALAQAEEGHRLNVRALGTRKPGTSLREGLDNLEHASVSVRTLLRAVHDATRERTGIREDAAYAEEVRLTTSVLMGRSRPSSGATGCSSAAGSSPGELRRAPNCTTRSTPSARTAAR
jgi:hypothetical protein